MKQFSLEPAITQRDTVKEFCTQFSIGKGDLLFVSNGTYERYFKGLTNGAIIVNPRKYGTGEPTDLMVEGICEEIQGIVYDRVIAVGGGTILDVAKLFSLKQVSPVDELYAGKIELVREKKLVLVPTTCGTGSEVTNIAILELTKKNTKMGLAVKQLFADDAVLIPELLEGLPFRFFATSSIDALIHSIESFTSPKASPFTEMFSRKAMRMILETYQLIAKDGEEARMSRLQEMLMASTFAGIAFGNAGCGAVHAMSYPLGAGYHVPHGEANYAMFTGVYRTYQEMDPNGKIKSLNAELADILGCSPEMVYEEIEALLDHILPKKALHEYGMKQEEIDSFAASVFENQQRLLANNYVPFTQERIKTIYQQLF